MQMLFCAEVCNYCTFTVGLAEDRATHLSEQVRENLLHCNNTFLLVRMI